MADQKSREFQCKKITLTTLNDNEFDVRDLVAEFRYLESIESAFTL